MTIAEKTQRAQEDLANVYNAGKAEGYTDGKADGYTEGAKSEYDKFWDAFQNNGTKTNYSYCFYTSNWTEKTFRPKYKLVPTNINNAFHHKTK